MAFNASGGVAYNFELELKDPVISTNGAPIIIDLLQGSTFKLFQSGEITLNMQPTFNAYINGNLTGKGISLLESSFRSEDSFGLSSTKLTFSNTFIPSGDTVYGVKESTILQIPTIKAKNLTVSDPSFFEASITPAVVWSLGYGEVTSTSILGENFYAGAQIVSDLLTSVTGTYQFSSTAAGEFQSNTTLSADMSFHSLNAYTMLGCSSQTPTSSSDVCGYFPLITTPYPNPDKPTIIYHHTDTQSLTVSSSASTGGGGNNNSSSSSSLSSGAIAAIVVVTAAVVTFLVLYFVFPRNGYSAAATKTASSPVRRGNGASSKSPKAGTVRTSELSLDSRFAAKTSSYVKETEDLW